METLDDSNFNGHPLTEEQLAYFAESEKRAVHSALLRYRRAAVVGFVVLLLGVGYNIYDVNQRSADGRDALVKSGRVVSVSGCNRDFNSISALRGLLTSARASQREAVKRGDIPAPSPAQQTRTDEFYHDQFQKIKLPDCRKAESLLTDDPDDLPAVPRPLYPKAHE